MAKNRFQGRVQFSLNLVVIVEMTGGSKRSATSFNDKLEAIRSYNAKKESGKQIAARLGVSPAAVSAWVKRGENHWADLVASHGSSKRAKPDKYPKVNSYVVGYLDAMAHLPVSAPKATSWSILMGAAQEKAKEFARDQPEYGNFAASKGWLYALLRRHGYVRVKLCGEAGSVDQEAAKQKMIEFRLQLHETGVSNPKAIFNADETALFYQTIPNFMYTKDPSGEERGTSAMASKHRVTVLPCANACGDKLPVLVIGKSRSPRAFRGRQMPDSIVYESQKNAWVDRALAKSWFIKVFVPGKRKLLGSVEKAVLFWDNAKPHILDQAVLDSYPEIVVMFLPPNLTSIYQPMDAGIIAALKRRYKYLLIERTSKLLGQWEQIRAAAEGKTSGTKGLGDGHLANMLRRGDALRQKRSSIASSKQFVCQVLSMTKFYL